jgi:hypothetical protein
MLKSLSDALIKLKARSRKVLLVALTESKPEPIPNIEIIHLPYSDPEVEK